MRRTVIQRVSWSCNVAIRTVSVMLLFKKPKEDVAPWTPKQTRLNEATKEALEELESINSLDELKALCEEQKRQQERRRP